MSEPHPDIVRKFGYADEHGKVQGKHKRKKVIDLRACRFCFLKQTKRDYSRLLAEREAERRRLAYEQAIANGEEINDPRLIPPEARPQRVLTRQGYDPVLLYCKHVLKDSKRRRSEVLRKADALLALRKERVAAGAEGIVGNSDDDPAMTFIKYQWKLYTARIELALLIRERRHRDLQSLSTVADPVRYDWSAYVTPEEKARVVRAARRANQHRVSIVLKPDAARYARVGARPFTWMPDLSFAMKNEKAQRKVVELAWGDHIARARNSRDKAHRFIRHSLDSDPMQERVRVFTPTGGSEQSMFTMVEFYRTLADAAHKALDLIEQAIEMGMFPTNYTMLGSEDAAVVTRWEQLVPLHAAEIREMRTGFNDMLNNKIDPFSRLFVPRVLRETHPKDPAEVAAEKERRRAQRRTRRQMQKGLDFNGLPLPMPAPAMEH
jgi:hypothetical protein